MCFIHLEHQCVIIYQEQQYVIIHQEQQCVIILTGAAVCCYSAAADK